MEADGLDLARLLHAFELSASVVGGAIGAVMAPSVKNDQGNLAVVRKSAAKFDQTGLRALLAAGSPQASGRALRPHASRSVGGAGDGLVAPPLALQTGIIRNLVDDRSAAEISR